MLSLGSGGPSGLKPGAGGPLGRYEHEVSRMLSVALAGVGKKQRDRAHKGPWGAWAQSGEVGEALGRTCPQPGSQESRGFRGESLREAREQGSPAAGHHLAVMVVSPRVPAEECETDCGQYSLWVCDPSGPRPTLGRAPQTSPS